MEETTEITGKMIKMGRTEQEYRDIPCDSSSSIKVFAEDRLKYYKKYVAQQWIEEEDSQAIIIGKLVDNFLLGTEEEFDNSFYRSTISQAPTGAIALFVEALFTRTMECVGEDGEVGRELEDIARDAYADVKFDKDGKQVAFKRSKVDSFEGVLERFMNSDAITYYREIREVRPKGLCVITSSQEDQAKRVVEQLRNSPNTKDIFDPGPDVQVFNQLKIDGFEIDGLPVKGMLDRVHVNHQYQKIQLFDLKCTWNVEDFYYQYYLKRKTYFQAYIYYTALLTFIDFGFDVSGYEILPPQFIVADSSAFYEPLIYKLIAQDLMDAYDGFMCRNRKYVGLKEVVDELKWSRANNIWNQSKNNFENNGIVMLNTKKED